MSGTSPFNKEEIGKEGVVMLAMPDLWREIEYIEYDPRENIFYDQCGIRIYDLYGMITPSDILLFKHNHQKYNEFYSINNPLMIYKILWNGVDDHEESNIHIPCQFSPRGGCWFSSDEQNARAEICRYCRGGDC